MGYYIQTPHNTHKAIQLVNLYNAEILPFEVPEFKDIPEHRALICVMVNGMFDAAAYIYSEAEQKVFQQDDGRMKTWLTMDKLLAQELSGYRV